MVKGLELKEEIVDRERMIYSKRRQKRTRTRRDLNEPIYSKPFPNCDVVQSEARVARGRGPQVLRGAANFFGAARA